MMKRARYRSRSLARRRFGERGFALLEILVAFVILALGLGGVLVAISAAMRADSKTEASRGALRVAQSRLEAAGASETLVPGQYDGRAGNKYTWRLTVTPVSSGEGTRDAPAKPSATTSSVAAFWVRVAVRASNGSTATLAALKLTPAVKP